MAPARVELAREEPPTLTPTDSWTNGKREDFLRLRCTCRRVVTLVTDVKRGRNSRGKDVAERRKEGRKKGVRPPGNYTSL